MHVFHPKVVHSSPIQFLHSRHDPNVGLINGGYPQPLLNLSPSSKEYRISEEDFFKWRREQQRKAQEKRRHLQQQQKHNRDDDEDDYEDPPAATGGDDEEEQPHYDDELYKKHKANKLNSNHRKESKQKNHNYTPDYDSSNSDKVYSNYSNSRAKSNGNKKQQRRPPQFKLTPEDEVNNKYRVYGVSNVDAESSNVDSQYYSHDPTAIDPGYYSTLPKNLKNVKSTHQDDIYSGLLARKYNREIADKSKLLADINYNRKQQAKNSIQKRRSDDEE